MNDLQERFEKPTAARVDVVANAPMVETAHKPPRGTQAAFLARNEGKKEQTNDQVVTADGSGVAVHTRPGTAIMYKPTERNGFMARIVSVSALPMLFRQGWHEFCPDCNDHHLDSKGKVTTDPNACKARPAVAVRVCPVCRKRIYDTQAAATVAETDDDPNVIQDEAYTNSTPVERTRQKLNLHLWIRHAEWAQSNGIDELPRAFREMVDQMPASSRGT